MRNILLLTAYSRIGKEQFKLNDSSDKNKDAFAIIKNSLEKILENIPRNDNIENASNVINYINIINRRSEQKSTRGGKRTQIINQKKKINPKRTQKPRKSIKKSQKSKKNIKKKKKTHQKTKKHLVKNGNGIGAKINHSKTIQIKNHQKRKITITKIH